MNLIEQCRTRELGGHKEKCTHCGNVKVHYNSCGNRNCPTCQGANCEKWMLERKYDLLPVPYFHVVFTLPDLLRDLLLYNKKQMYDMLFLCVKETLTDFSQDPKWKLNAKIGFISIIHTWTQQLMYHPHIHCILPGGGINKEGKWCTSKGSDGFLFHVKPMSDTFRGKIMEGIDQAYYGKNNNLKLEGKLEQLRNPANYEQLKNTLYKKNWVVHTEESFEGPDQVFEYLARYTHKIAISNYRIKNITATHVTFSYIDRSDGNKQKLETITGEKFIYRFLQHVLPEGYTKIRHNGFLSTRSKQKDLPIIRKALSIPKPAAKQKLTLREVVKITTGKDYQCCDSCKIGKMVAFSIINPTRGSPKKGLRPAEKDFI